MSDGGFCLLGSKFSGFWSELVEYRRLVRLHGLWGFLGIKWCLDLETTQIPFDELGANESESQELKSSGTQNGIGMK